VRGGAIPVLAWAGLLFVLFVGNWIWDAKAVNAAEAAFSAVIIFAAAFALWLARHEAIRRGPPPPQRRIEASPSMSLGAVLAGLGVGAILFGLVWAQFIFIFGIGLLIVAIGRLAIEMRSERASRRAMLDHAAAPTAHEEVRR